MLKHPVKKMRDYTAEELKWEYEVEYLKYTAGRGIFVHAFSSLEHFAREMDTAPIEHLSIEQFYSLENSMACQGLGKDERWVHNTFSHRRDSLRIVDTLRSGRTAPPIVLRYHGRLRLMAGQTRLAAGLALGINVPVKILDVVKE